MKKRFKNECGAATVLEYTIVFPIILVIVFLLLDLGSVMYEKAIVVSAVQRGGIMSSRILANPHYGEISGTSGCNEDYNEITGINMENFTAANNKPYRYIFSNNGDFADGEQQIRTIIDLNSYFFKDDNMSIDVTSKNHFISKQIQIKVKKAHKIGFITPIFDMGSNDIEYTLTLDSDNPVEFIRNVDLANDLLRDFTGNDVQGHIKNVFEKVKGVLNKFGSK